MTTTEPYSETSIANIAIDILDDVALTDLNQGGTVANFMARNFGPARDWLQQVYPAHFTKAYTQLAVDFTDPAFGWYYSYTPPADCIRVLPLRADGAWNGALIAYEMVGGKIYTNQSAPLNLVYIAKKTNAAQFPPAFARLLACRLALLAAQNITGKTSYVEKAKGLYDEAMEFYRLTDSLESGTPEDQYDDNIVAVRGVGIAA